MKKKLLFFIDSLGCGGAEKSLISLLPLIDYDRYDVDLIVYESGGAFEKFVPSQVRIIDYTRAYHKNSLWRKILVRVVDCYLSPQMRLIKRHHAEILWRGAKWFYKRIPKQYDVAIAYQQGFPTFFLTDKVDASKRIAWINVDPYEAGYDMDYCRQFYEKLDHVVAVSKKLHEKLEMMSPWMADKITCIYDIVNQDVIRQMANEPINDMTHHDGKTVIVTVGRLVPQKNYLLAVKTARLLKKQGLSFKWYFVGEGEMRTAIEESIKEYGLNEEVILLGFKENPYPYMAKADIYVQTSSFEGFGLTIAEAKILHKPVVSTNFDVVKDQISDRQNGLIAEMTPQSVADRILELLHDDTLRNHIVHNLGQENNLTAVTEVEKFNALVAND